MWICNTCCSKRFSEGRDWCNNLLYWYCIHKVVECMWSLCFPYSQLNGLLYVKWQGLVPGGALKPIDASPDASSDVTEHYWFPMLAGLSDLTSDPRVEVRNCALEVLFDLLNERGTKFSPSFWESIFRRVLFPIFDHVRHAGKEASSDDEWLHETCIHSLQLLCNLFNTFYKVCTCLLLNCLI